MTFWSLFVENAAALESAIAADDADAFLAIVNESATTLVGERPELNLNIGGHPPRLSILSLPGAEQLADQFVADAPKVKNWQIHSELPVHDPLQSIQVSDDAGGSLDIRYADLDGKVLLPKDELVTVVLSLDADFDPRGPQSHLYNAVAENVIFTVLGGWPQVLAKVVLLPRTQTGKLMPLETLRIQWLNVVGPTRSA